MVRNLHHRIEEGILLGIILLNVGDFLDLITGDVELIKLLISWAVLGYLIFRVGLTKVMFNNERKGIDGLIILAYILFIFKNLVAYSHEAISKSDLFTHFYSYVIDNADAIVLYPFAAGAVLLALVSAYLAYKVEIKSPSLLHIIHEDGKPPKDPLSLFIRFCVILVVLAGFFVVVFNLVMEWIAMITDAPLIMFAILFYLFIIIRHHKRFTAESLLYRVGRFSEEFYVSFVNLFRYKKRIVLGISGLLVLHLLTEIEVFLIPYIFGLKEITYISKLDGNHWPILSLFRSDYSILASPIDAIPLGSAYLLNIIAMVFFLSVPAYIWYKLYKGEGFAVNNTALGVFFSSMVGFLLLRAFIIRPLSKEGIAGVDIITESILENVPSIAYLYLGVLVALGIGGLIVYLSRSHGARSKIIATGIIFIDLFFSIYIFFFSVSVVQNYISIIKGALASGAVVGPIIIVSMGLFLLLTILFYVGGFIAFIIETRKEFLMIRK